MSNLFYVYGIVKTGEPVPSFSGIGGETDTYTVTIGDLDAVVCNVRPEEFGEDALKKK